MRKIAKYLAATTVLTLALTVNAKAAVKSVTITAPTKSASYTTYRAGKNITKTLKVTVKTTSKKDSKAVTYKSSNPKVVSVTSKGKLTFKKTGKATITVASKKSPKIKDTLKITVKQGATKIAVSTKDGYAIGKTFTLTKGKSISTKVLESPSSASNKVKWTTSNKKVATVSSKGVIKAVGTGSAKITAVAADGCGAKFTTTIKVVTGKVTGLSVNKKSVTLVKGKTSKVTAKVSTSGKGANTKLLWTSSNTKVATVSQSGTIKAIKKGTATITVRTVDGSNKKATIKVTVLNSQPATTKPTETTAKPEDPTTAKPEEPTTAKPEETTTAKPEETTTVKPEETTTPKQEETTTPKQEETTTPKQEETTTERPTEPESETVTSFKVTVDTEKAVTGGITAEGTNTIKWAEPDEAFKAATDLTNDSLAIVNKLNAILGTKLEAKFTGVSLKVNNNDYVTKFEDNKWKLFNAQGTEVDVKTTLQDKTITDLNIKKDTTKEELDNGLERLYHGHNNIDEEAVYDYGKGTVTVGDKEFVISKAVMSGASKKAELTVNRLNITVDIKKDHSFVVESVDNKDISSIKDAVKVILTTAVKIA